MNPGNVFSQLRKFRAGSDVTGPGTFSCIAIRQYIDDSLLSEPDVHHPAAERGPNDETLLQRLLPARLTTPLDRVVERHDAGGERADRETVTDIAEQARPVLAVLEVLRVRVRLRLRVVELR